MDLTTEPDVKMTTIRIRVDAIQSIELALDAEVQNVIYETSPDANPITDVSAYVMESIIVFIKLEICWW